MIYKRILCIIALSTLLVHGYGQSKIGSFYGVNLGDSKAAVERGISSQGKTGSWKYSESKHCEYYSVKSPKIAGCYFDGASFYMKNNQLHSACFFAGDGGLMDPSHPANPVGQFDTKARKYRSTFETLADKLSDKYGTPFQFSDTRIVWKDHGRKVTLEYEYKKERNQYGWYDTWSRVALTYEIVDVSSSDF